MIMNTWDIRLLSASYLQEGEDVVMELFGKTRDQKSITVLSRGFKPYYFILDPDERVYHSLKLDSKIVSYDKTTLFYHGADHEAVKITLRLPWDATEHKNRWKKEGYTILSGDIAFHYKYLYDMDMASCIRVSGDVVESEYLTDLTVEMSSFENITSFDPGLKYLSFDIENSVKHDFLYCICAVVYENNEFKECEPISGSEPEIIKKFGELIQQEDPDVITGYNIDNYDIRKILERAQAKKVSDPLPWGRDKSQPKLISDRFWRIKGRLVVDAWWAAKKELRPKQESLNAVSSMLLGEKKMDVDPSHMDDEWKNDRENVIKYCIKDAQLALKILLKVETVRKGLDLAVVSRLPAEDVLTSGTSTYVDSLLIRAADRKNIGVPPMGRRISGEQIEGGYVHNMVPGLYHWVCVLDFKSMYPSLIISKNICFTTLNKEGEIEAPDGTRFVSKDKREGLLPRILEDLMNERDSIKRQMKETTDETEKHYLNGLQEAVKVLMNTFYGVFASSFYRFTDRSIGAAITSFARNNVKTIIQTVTEEGVKVIYSDTDSVFMSSPVHELEGAVEFGTKMANRFSKEGGILEFEKLLDPLFTHGAKKRYVGKVVWPEKQDDILIRGYEVRRSDSFNLQSDVLTKVFEKVLEEKNEEAVSLVKTTIQNILAGKVSAEDLVISKNCKGMDAYQNPDNMANVQAAKKLMKLGYEFIPGMKVSWIVTDASGSPQRVEPYISGKEVEFKPDYKYYAGRLAQSASRVTEVFGWTEKDLMLGSQQATLFDGSFETSPMPSHTVAPVKKEEPKPKVKNTSLSDFF